MDIILFILYLFAFSIPLGILMLVYFLLNKTGKNVKIAYFLAPGLWILGIMGIGYFSPSISAVLVLITPVFIIVYVVLRLILNSMNNRPVKIDTGPSVVDKDKSKKNNRNAILIGLGVSGLTFVFFVVIIPMVLVILLFFILLLVAL